MRALELKVPPLALAAMFAAAMHGASLIASAATLVIPGRIGIAVGLALLGLLVALAGVVAFRAHRTTVNPLTPSASSALVSNGIYRITRNPMYLGVLLALAGWAVWLSNAVAAAILPGFVAYMNEYQIKPEERALLAKFGSEFEQYMAAVRRWV